ncbi:MAG TPA: FHA domain-containing protein [Gemmatales bacterium]|nr:FHA domain-containing protein [Gemmatales bacterium]
MPVVRRIYLHTLIGAIGGWIGWMLFGEICSPDWNWQQLALSSGLIIGACIGLGLAVIEAIIDQSLIRFLRYGAVGIILGGLGGATGCYLGEWVNYSIVVSAGATGKLAMVGTILARMLGWALFGAAVGICEGVAVLSHRKILYGLIGGSLGGALGGLLYGLLLVVLKPGESTYLWGQSLGLALLAALIGLLRALVEEAFKPATLRILQGWHEGREYPIIKDRTVLGREETVDILLLRDMAVMKQHALLKRSSDRFFLQRLHGSPQDTRVNDVLVEDEIEIKTGDRIQLGATTLRFICHNSTPLNSRNKD